MFDIVLVVLPIFSIVALGYGAVRIGWFPGTAIPGLIAFVNNFATPCLLFRAMFDVDFATAFDPVLMVGFYAGALIAFALGIVFGLLWARRRPGESVSFGFAATYSNTVMLGIPIISRAYGEPVMVMVYPIIGLHAVILLTIGMLTMEIARRDGQSLGRTLAEAGRRILLNPLLIGIALGAAGNLLGLALWEPVDAFTALMAAAVIPTALFGLGGALVAYRLADSWREALVLSLIKLVVHPAIAWVILVPLAGLDPATARLGVLLAAMPAGINAYIFATYYKRGIEVAANAVLIATVLSVVTISVWLYILRI